MPRYANVDKLMKHAINLDWSTLKWVNEVDICTAINPNVVERKKGKWTYHSNPAFGINAEGAYCSCCNYHIDTTMVDFDDYNFCPSCGAGMREETDMYYPQVDGITPTVIGEETEDG